MSNPILNRFLKHIGKEILKKILTSPAFIKTCALLIALLVGTIVFVGSCINQGKTETEAAYKEKLQNVQAELDSINAVNTDMALTVKDLRDSLLIESKATIVFKEVIVNTVTKEVTKKDSSFVDIVYRGKNQYFDIAYYATFNTANPEDIRDARFQLQILPVTLYSMVYMDTDGVLRMFAQSSNPFLTFNLSKPYIDKESFTSLMKLSQKPSYKTLDSNLRYFINPSYQRKNFEKHDFNLQLGVRYKFSNIYIDKYGWSAGLIYEGKIF